MLELSEKLIHQQASRACKRRRGTVQNHQPPAQSQTGRPRRSRLPQCPSRARTKDASQDGARCNASPARIAHPAVAEFGAGAGRLDHGPDQQVADENSVRSQSHREVVQEIAQLSKDQDVKTKDHVGRVQGVLDSLAVRLRDDTEFATKAQSDPQPHDNDHGKSRFEVARRDQDDLSG